MTTREAEPTIIRQSEETPYPVDITKIEASDSVQSHLSTSSKRTIRVLPSNTPDTSGKLSNCDALDAHPERFPSLRRIVAYAQTFLFPDSPLLPTAGRAARLERSWTKLMTKYVFVFYCSLSCMITSVRLYVSIFDLQGSASTAGTPFASVIPSESTRSMAQYLTRSSATSPTILEPFVLSSGNTYSNVTICAWLSDSELHLLKNWTPSSQVSLSLLITTSAPFSSPQHKNLLGTMRKQLHHLSASGVSIHILHVKATEVGSPNLYLNLARLFAFTDWILLVPGELNNTRLQENISSINFEAGTGAYLLTSGAHTYPFPDLSPLLLRKDRDFWCTERFFAGGSRAHDWSECLWQFYLEMTGKVAIVDMPSSNKMVSTEEDRAFIAVGLIRQRLTARFRAETCDTFVKQISGLYPRTRHRTMEIDWAKAFCAKTVNRKMSR